MLPLAVGLQCPTLWILGTSLAGGNFGGKPFPRRYHMHFTQAPAEAQLQLLVFRIGPADSALAETLISAGHGEDLKKPLVLRTPGINDSLPY